MHKKKVWLYDNETGAEHGQSPFDSITTAGKSIGCVSQLVSYALDKENRFAFGWAVRSSPGFTAKCPYICEVLTYSNGEVAGITPYKSFEDVAKATGVTRQSVHQAWNSKNRLFGKKRFYMREYTGATIPAAE